MLYELKLRYKPRINVFYLKHLKNNVFKKKRFKNTLLMMEQKNKSQLLKFELRDIFKYVFNNTIWNNSD